MSFKANPQSIIQLGASNADGYFCQICTTASGEIRKVPGSNEHFIDIKITRTQALHLLEQLQQLIDQD